MKRLKLILVLLIWATIMLGALCWCLVGHAAVLPTPKFSVALPLPVPQFGELEIIHTSKPTVKPTILNHVRNWMDCNCGQKMCVGQHLRNAHGITHKEWNTTRLWEGNTMYRLHKKLHDEGVYEKPKPKDGCGPGGCPAPQRVGIIKRTVNAFRWRR